MSEDPSEFRIAKLARGKDVFFEVQEDHGGNPALYMNAGGHIDIFISFESEKELADVLSSLKHALETHFDPLGVGSNE